MRIVASGSRGRALGGRLGGELADDPLLGGRWPGHSLVALQILVVLVDDFPLCDHDYILLWLSLSFWPISGSLRKNKNILV